MARKALQQLTDMVGELAQMWVNQEAKKNADSASYFSYFFSLGNPSTLHGASDNKGCILSKRWCSS